LPARNLERVTAHLAILFDCDNTLLDNDAAKDEFNRRLAAQLGPDETARFWAVYESARADRTVVDIPLTIERFVVDSATTHALTAIFFDFPFRNFVYPAVPEVIAYARSFARVAVLSDGDQVFQRHKIRQSGLEDLVGGGVYVFDHKEEAVVGLIKDLPAAGYVTVDDKPHLLTALKRRLGGRLTTVFVRQGKYARTEPVDSAAVDFTLDSIGDFLKLTPADLNPVSAA
jgi:beta-phosphoglucomutase-like phosphatase (HAD superfamily)